MDFYVNADVFFSEKIGNEYFKFQSFPFEMFCSYYYLPVDILMLHVLIVVSAIGL